MILSGCNCAIGNQGIETAHQNAENYCSTLGIEDADITCNSNSDGGFNTICTVYKNHTSLYINCRFDKVLENNEVEHGCFDN